MKKIILTTIAAGLSAVSSVSADAKMSYITCSACHGADGKGVPVGAKKMAPSLVDSKIVTGDASVLALSILKGIKKEGTDYIGMMAPLEAVYTDDQKLADVLTYVRQSFGNEASAVSKEDAAKYREMWKDINEPVTRAKLEELSKKTAE